MGCSGTPTPIVHPPKPEKNACTGSAATHTVYCLGLESKNTAINSGGKMADSFTNIH